MSNEAIEQMLAEKFQTGFLHPGDPENDVPPTPVVLPFKPSPGMPKEMGDLMTGTAKLLAECVVSEIETTGDCEIVPRGEMRSMRRSIGDDDAMSLMPIYCRCDTKRQRPLAVLTVIDPGNVVVDGAAFIRELSKRDPKCPHEVIKK